MRPRLLHRLRPLLLAATVGAALAGCSDTPAEAPTAAADPDATDTTATPADTPTDTTPEVAGDPKLGGLDRTVALHPTDGDGRPLFGWDPVDGAASYVITVEHPDGTPYWAWETDETSVRLGLSERPSGAPGPRATEEMRWSVVALDGDGVPIASSPRTRIG